MELERSTFDEGRRLQEYLDGSVVDLVRIGGRLWFRATFLPGHRWSAHVAPLVGTTSCEQRHVGYVLEGCFRVVMDTGEVQMFEAGDLYAIPAGHDAEIVGDGRCVCLETAASPAAP